MRAAAAELGGLDVVVAAAYAGERRQFVSALRVVTS